MIEKCYFLIFIKQLEKKNFPLKYEHYIGKARVIKL